MTSTGLDDSEPLGTTRSPYGTSSSAASGGTDRLADAAGGVAERVADTAQRQVGTQVNSGLAKAGDMLEQVANAVRKGGEDMREQQPQVAGFADTAASQVDKAAQFVRHTDFKGLVHEAEGFARRQPAVFFGGALVVGLLASRFLKASPEGGSGTRGSGQSYQGSYGSRATDPYGSRGSYGAGYGSPSAGGYGSTQGMTGTSRTGVEHGGV